MVRTFRLESALLPEGWVRNARVSVGDDGVIGRIDIPAAAAAGEGGDAGAEQIRGFVIPGMSNAHSHAFQRGMAGNTEFRLSAQDSFWTWRQAMYALANRIAPEDLKVLAAQLFIEMLKSGYTAVAEFHYIHRRLDGETYAGANALWDAVTAAAEETGIALTFLPTLYQTSDFGAAPLKREQMRFALETDQFLRAVEARLREEARRDCPAESHRRRVPQSARGAAAGARAGGPGAARHVRRSAAAHPRGRTGERGRGLHRAHRPTARRAAARNGAPRSALVSRARHPFHGGRARGNRRHGRFGLRVDHDGGEPRGRIFRCGPIPEARRTPMRRLRQPVHGVSRRGIALDGVSSAPAQAAPRGARRPRKRVTSARGSGRERRATEPARSGSPPGSSRSGRAPIGWCSTGTIRASSEPPMTALWTIWFLRAQALRSAMSWWAAGGRSRRAGMRSSANWPRRFASSCGNGIGLDAAP